MSAEKLSAELETIANELSARIAEVLGERCGFTLMVFSGKRAQYVSNCDRQESVDQIKSLLDYWGAGGPDIPAHKVH